MEPLSMATKTKGKTEKEIRDRLKLHNTTNRQEKTNATPKENRSKEQRKMAQPKPANAPLQKNNIS